MRKRITKTSILKEKMDVIKKKVETMAERLWKFEGYSGNRKIPRHESPVINAMWMEDTIYGIWGYLRSDTKFGKKKRVEMVNGMYDSFKNLAILYSVKVWADEINTLREEYRVVANEIGR